MKRITALILAIVMVLSLAACGGGSDTTAGTTSVGETDVTTAGPSFNGDYKSLIPATEQFDLSAGEWIDCGSYGYYKLENIDSNAFRTYSEAELQDYGYTMYLNLSLFGGSEKTFQKFTTGTEYTVATAYHSGSGTLLIFAGEVPHSYYCWQALGLTADEIGDPFFEEDHKDYIAYTAGSIDLNFCDSASGDSFTVFQACGITKEQAGDLIAAAKDMGYVESVREEPDGESFYYEAKLKVYEEFEVYMTMQLALYQDKLLVVFAAPYNTKDADYIWENVKQYDGTATGVDPNAGNPSEPTVDTSVLDLSAAASMDTLGSATVYYFEGDYVEAARSYIDSLFDQGYAEEEMPYVPDIMPYYVEYAHNWLVNESMGDFSHIIVVGWSEMTMVITSAEKQNFREHDLWDMVGCAVYFQMGYLETVFWDFYYNHGAMGSGQGWSSDGYFSSYGNGCDMESVNYMIGELKAAGFTEYGTTTENGAKIWVYSRTDEYQYLSATIYARILLDGDFGEVEFGYGFRNESQNME